AQRSSAARALALAGDRAATSHLVVALEDSTVEVRRTAVESLATLRDPKAVAPLEALLEREKSQRDKVNRKLVQRAIEACTVSEPEAPEQVTPSDAAGMSTATLESSLHAAVPPVEEVAVEEAAAAVTEPVALEETAVTTELVAVEEQATDAAPEATDVMPEAAHEIVADDDATRFNGETLSAHAEIPSVEVTPGIEEILSGELAAEGLMSVGEAVVPPDVPDELPSFFAEHAVAPVDVQADAPVDVAERVEALEADEITPDVREAETGIESVSIDHTDEHTLRDETETPLFESLPLVAEHAGQESHAGIDLYEPATIEVLPSASQPDESVAGLTAETSNETAKTSNEIAPAGEWFELNMDEARNAPDAHALQTDAPSLESGTTDIEAVNADAQPHVSPVGEAWAAEPVLVEAISGTQFEPTLVDAPPVAEAKADDAERSIEPFDELSTVPKAIQQRLTSREPSDRAAAITELSHVDSGDAFHQICAAFDDEAKEVRGAAARALYELKEDRADSFTRALRESDAERRRNIGAAIASSGLASDAISQLTGESRDKTYEAFSLLFLMAKAGEVQPLIRAIEGHPDNEVRLAVVKLLALSGQKEILPAFRRLAVRGSLPTEVRSAVMEAIYQISSGQQDATTPAA
ncbi:MAG: HEAT repeat domain-containing protein, partial [Pyrinomonadaceae bacterium]